MKRRILIPILIILTVAAMLWTPPIDGSDRLTAEEIAALREEYPVYGDTAMIDQLIVYDPPTLNEIRMIMDTVVYCEVTGGISGYRERLYQYPVRAISDTEGMFEKGEEFYLIANKAFKYFNPPLEAGMKLAVPVGKHKDNRYSYSVVGMYYVTDDGYAISAYEETDTILSGLKVTELMKLLQK